MTAPRVSVVIPTYGHAGLVRATLESVFAQTANDHGAAVEVIVVNDGSPDGTAEVVRPLADAGRIRYVEQPNAGQAAARNRGLSLATGEFVAFLDDDDLWPADSLAWRVSALLDHPGWAAVAGRVAFMDGAGVDLGQVGPCVPELTFDGLFDGNPINSPGQVLVRASALRAAGGLDATIWGADDWDLLFRLAQQGPVHMVDRVALRYRVHGGNATRYGRRLYLGSLRTVRRQLATVADPRQRRARARAGYTFLYTAWADRLAADARRAVRAGHLLDAVRTVAALATMLRGTWALPGLPAGLVARATVPPRFRRWLRRALVRPPAGGTGENL